MTWGWHVNVLTAEAKRDVLEVPADLKLLDTARDLELIREWRARNPDRLLVYRHVFPNGTPSEDWQGRCDVLAREAEALLPHDVIVETPWNEEMFANDLLPRYASLTSQAVDWLNKRGFQKTCVGNFPVQWPRLMVWPHFWPALQQATYLGLHLYGAPVVTSDWERNVGHVVPLVEALPPDLRRPVLATEFGKDWGVLGSDYAQLGWLGGRSVNGTHPIAYASELREAALRLQGYVRALFIYCSGGIYGWQSFEVAGVSAIRELVKEVYPVWEFQMGFRDLARAMQTRGLNPGTPLGPEMPHVFEDGFVVTRQETTTGEMLWIKSVNQPMFAGRDGRLVFYNGGNLLVTVKGV